MDLISRNNFLRSFLRLWAIYYAVALCFIPFSNANEQQPLGRTTPKRVAIVGAGAGGSSTAYSLRKYADSLQIPVDITVFERASYVGGRSTTVNVFNDPAYPIELGASIFVSVNHNLVNASKEFGLAVRSADYARPKESDDTIGIWDGKQFAFVLKDTSSWWSVAKLLWRYGLAPIRTQSLMKSTVNQFLQMYESPVFPFKSLSTAAAAVGLLDTTSTPGDVFLQKNSISSDFSREIIQASTRVNYGQNLGLIHGLESMVCMATDGAVSIEGGNWLIFDSMVKSSQSDLKVNHTVTSIHRNPDGTLTVSFKANSSNEESQVFDEVVIAGPFQYSGLTINPPLENPPDEIPFVKLYVTLFSSPHRLSPKSFGLNGLDDEAPETILTTLPPGMDLGSSSTGVGPAGFWSISTLQTVESPESNHEKHYVYKIFSPEQLTAEFVENILGLNKSDTASLRNSTIADLSKRDISWYHEKIWNPYPFLYPRVTFEETILAPNIWCTGGIESFISTMETSALMGKNVAALMSQSWKDQRDEDMAKMFMNREEKTEL